MTGHKFPQKGPKNLVEGFVEAGVAVPEVWFCHLDQYRFNQLCQAHKNRMNDSWALSCGTTSSYGAG